MLTWNNTGDPTAPEALSYVNHLMPTRIGYSVALSPGVLTRNNPAVVRNTNSLSFFGLSYFNNSGVQNFFYSLGNKLYRYPNNIDVSRAAPYTGIAFSFAQYRDKIFASNGLDAVQRSSAGSSFSDVGSMPQLKRICTNGEYLGGVGLGANWTNSAGTINASDYLFMVSAVGNPEQFDPTAGTGDTTAFYQDIRDSGGPLTAIARLRDMFVIFQRSGVRIAQNVGPGNWAIQPISDYFGCEWPDSIIEINNVLYWISPTRKGEVVAFDGTRIEVLSQALQSTIVDSSTAVDELGFPTGLSGDRLAGLTAATDGETIIWNRVRYAEDFASNDLRSEQLYYNIATGRFGFSNRLQAANSVCGVFSSADQRNFFCIKIFSRSSGSNLFQVGTLGGLGLGVPAIESSFEMYRSTDAKSTVSIDTVLLIGSEAGGFVIDTTAPYLLLEGSAKQGISRNLSATPYGDSAFYLGANPLRIASTDQIGQIFNKGINAKAVVSPPQNTDTLEFNVSGPGSVGRAFAFEFNVTPRRSLTKILVIGKSSGSSSSGPKPVVWQ